MITKDNRGFTLVELLVVISIIGLLSTLAVVALQGARVKSRDAKRVADIKQVQTALELYASEKGVYPTLPPLPLVPPPAVFAAPWEIGTDLTALRLGGWNSAVLNEKTFMGLTPKDPDSTDTSVPCEAGGARGCNYVYAIGAQPSQYSIIFFLEEKTGNLAPGLHCASEAGISADANCNH